MFLVEDALASVNYYFKGSLGICLSILVLLTTLGFCLPSFFNITITVVSSDVRLVKYLYITFSAEGCFVACIQFTNLLPLHCNMLRFCIVTV